MMSIQIALRRYNPVILLFRLYSDVMAGNVVLMPNRFLDENAAVF
jgi:hypothetical protein